MPGIRTHRQPGSRVAARRLSAESTCPEDLAQALAAYANGTGELGEELRMRALDFAREHYPALAPSLAVPSAGRAAPDKRAARPATAPHAKAVGVGPFCRITRSGGTFIAEPAGIPEAAGRGRTAVIALENATENLHALARLNRGNG